MDSEALGGLIGELEAIVDEVEPRKGYWSGAWGKVREVGAAFKETPFDSREERQASWERFQELVTRLRERSKESQARQAARQQEWERRSSASESVRERLTGKAQSARMPSEFERAIANMILLPVKILPALIGRIAGVDVSELEEIHQDLLSCSRQLAEAWAEFKERKGELLPHDRAQAYAELRKAQELLDAGWREWKERKARERGEIQRARARVREERQREWERRQEEFRARVAANVEKLREKRAKAEAALARHRERREDLQEKYSSAWNDSFRDRCGTWLEECEERIASIEESIERLDRWISEALAKLD